MARTLSATATGGAYVSSKRYGDARLAVVAARTDHHEFAADHGRRIGGRARAAQVLHAAVAERRVEAAIAREGSYPRLVAGSARDRGGDESLDLCPQRHGRG